MLNLPSLFGKSVYSPAFYRELDKKPLSFSFKYFYTLAGMLAFAFAVIATTYIVPWISGFINSAGPALVASFPPDTKIEVRGGEAIVNAPQPLMFPMPQELRNYISENTPQNVLVVDTNSDFSVQKFRNYDTFAWLMRDQVAFMEKKNDIRINSLLDVPDFAVTREDLEHVLTESKWLIRGGLLALILLVFLVMGVGMLLVLSFELLNVLLVAFFIQVLFRLRKRKISFKKAFQLGMHAASIAIVIAAVSWLTGAYVSQWFTVLLTLLIVWLNVGPRVSVAESP